MSGERQRKERPLGTVYELHSGFGSIPAAPLLRAVAAVLEPGGFLEFDTVLHKGLAQFLKQNGTRVRRFWFHSVWHVRVESSAHEIIRCAEVAEQQGVTELAVWFTAYDRNKGIVLEAEVGNRYVWLGYSVPKEHRDIIVSSMGGCSAQYENTRPLPSVSD